MPNTAPELPSPAPAGPWRRRWLHLLALGASFVMVLLLRPEPTPSSAQPASVPAGWPNPPPSLKQRLQSSTPKWVSRLRDRFRTPPRQVVLMSSLLPLTNGVPAGSIPHGVPALSEPNGFRIWIVSSNDWRGISERLTKTAEGAAFHGTICMQTVHGTPATLSRGSSHGMFTLQHSPLIRGDMLDLTTVFSFLETTPLRTNGPFAARMQIPAGHRALLLHEPPPGDTRPSLALLVTPTLRPKR